MVSDEVPGARQVTELAAALTRCGHDVSVHLRQTDSDGFRDLLARQWRRRRPDVVHAHFWESGLVSLLAARGLGLPVVQTFHTFSALARGPARPREERMVARHATQVAATCTEEKFDLIRSGVRRPRVSVVPYGVDLVRFTPDGPVAKRGDRPRIVCVTRSATRQEHDVAIAALARIPDAELVVAQDQTSLADGPDTRRLKEVAERRGVAHRVVVVPRLRQDALPALLRSADLALCVGGPALASSLPLEAMACGVPVVAATPSDVDALIDGVTGNHVRSQEPAEIAHVVRRLLADPGRRESYGVGGRDRAQACCSWKHVALEAVHAYEGAGA
ncbi:glycosyl transferase [Lentzea sp. NBRC 102530]|nr:glycosyl transferase [Lentzea sp. NBRC 102530]